MRTLGTGRLLLEGVVVGVAATAAGAWRRRVAEFAHDPQDFDQATGHPLDCWLVVLLEGDEAGAETTLPGGETERNHFKAIITNYSGL